MSGKQAPVVFVLWEEILDDLLDRTEKFPKRIRFTISSRIENLALDIYEQLIIARYTSNVGMKAHLLHELNVQLERLRLLLRLCHRRNYLSNQAFRFLMDMQIPYGCDRAFLRL